MSGVPPVGSSVPGNTPTGSTVPQMTGYERAYGQPRADRRDPERCAASVLRNGFYTGRTCSRRNVDGKHCRQHAKVAK